MSNVNAIQQQLLHAIFNNHPSETFEKQGLAIYRANLRATAVQALSITFPTVKALIGENLFVYAAERLLQTQPPTQGDWALWGESLADILNDIDELKNFPFIPDCAHLDYLCHQHVRAKDHVIDTESLKLLNTHDPDQIRIEFAPTLTVLASKYPIADIWAAHKLPERERQEQLANSFNKHQTLQRKTIDQNYIYYFACYRQGYQVSVTPLTALEHRWYHLLKQYSLGEALEHIDTQIFSLDQWLINSIQHQIIYRFSII